MGSLPIIIFVVFLVAISALGAFLDMLAKMAARAEQERRARVRDEQARLRPPQQHQQPVVQAVARPAPPPPQRRGPTDEEILRQMLGEAPPQPAGRPRPPVARPVARAKPRPAPAPSQASASPGTLASHHLAGGLSDHHLAPTISVFGTGKQAGAVVAAKGPQGLAMLDALPPLARALVLTELLGKPLASRPRHLHRTRAV